MEKEDAECTFSLPKEGATVVKVTQRKYCFRVSVVVFLFSSSVCM